MTPDARPILGPAGPEDLFLAAGWSGTGFKKAPAIGAELARWIASGVPERQELESYDLTRFEEGALIRGEHEYTASTPH
jgi:sarcosine oxidase subunit beta